MEPRKASRKPPQAAIRSDVKPLSLRIMTSMEKVLWPALGYGLIAVVFYAFEGREIAREGGPTLSRLLALYATAAVLTGLILGLLSPFANGWLRTGLVSILVAWPAGFLIMFFVKNGDYTKIDAIDVALALALAVVIGPLGAAYVHARKHG